MLGEGAREQPYNLNKIRRWGGSISSGNGKKVKNHGIMHRVVHDFYVKINPRQKSGDAVACANVAPVRLHRLICHKGINTWQIIAPRRRNWGGGSHYIIGIWAQLAGLGIIFRSAGRHPKK